VSSTNKEGDDQDSRQREDPSRLIDEVMRGERTMLVPPGTLAASVVVPTFAVGIGAVTSGAAVTPGREPEAIAVGTLAAVAVLAVVIVSHVLVVQGRSHHRLWLRRYARVLAGASFALALFGEMQPLLATVGIAAFALCELLCRSRSYLAFASFMSIKRQYREDEAKARRRVLGHHE
jgi:hypothetical protein